METKIVVTIIKGLWQKALYYCKNELIQDAKIALPTAFKAFCDVIWKAIKEDVEEISKEIIEDAKEFLTSVEAQKQEEIILDNIMERIKLPVILRPFKGLIRKIIKNKIEDVISDIFKLKK